MNKQIVKSFLIAFTITLTGSVIYAQGEKKEVNHHVGEVGKGPHGGTIQEADPYHAELSGKDGMVMLYLLDGDAKPLSNSGVTAKATFLMPDGKSVNETLTASGSEGFMANGKDVVNYKSAIASFTVKGVTVSAKFKNDTVASGKSMSYVCPMHSDVKSDKAGTCSKCGMALVKKEDKH